MVFHTTTPPVHFIREDSGFPKPLLRPLPSPRLLGTVIQRERERERARAREGDCMRLVKVIGERQQEVRETDEKAKEREGESLSPVPRSSEQYFQESIGECEYLCIKLSTRILPGLRMSCICSTSGLSIQVCLTVGRWWILYAGGAVNQAKSETCVKGQIPLFEGQHGSWAATRTSPSALSRP